MVIFVSDFYFRNKFWPFGRVFIRIYFCPSVYIPFNSFFEFIILFFLWLLSVQKFSLTPVPGPYVQKTILVIILNKWSLNKPKLGHTNIKSVSTALVFCRCNFFSFLISIFHKRKVHSNTKRCDDILIVCNDNKITK